MNKQSLMCIIYICYVLCAQNLKILCLCMTTPNELVLRCSDPHGWEFSSFASAKNRGVIVNDSLASVIFTMGQSLKDTTIKDSTYTGVELLVICEKKDMVMMFSSAIHTKATL